MPENQIDRMAKRAAKLAQRRMSEVCSRAMLRALVAEEVMDILRSQDDGCRTDAGKLVLIVEKAWSLCGLDHWPDFR